MKRILTTKTLTLGLLALVAATTLVGCGNDDKKKSGGNIYTNRDGAAGARTDTSPQGGFSQAECQGNSTPADPMACPAGRAMNPSNEFKKFLSADLATNDPNTVGTITAAALWLKITLPGNGHYNQLPAGGVSFGDPNNAPQTGDANHIRFVIWDSLVGHANPNGGTFQPIQVDLPPAQPTADNRISGTIGPLTGGGRSFTLRYVDRYGTINFAGQITASAQPVLNITSVQYQNNTDANVPGSTTGQFGNLGGTLQGLGVGPSILY